MLRFNIISYKNKTKLSLHKYIISFALHFIQIENQDDGIRIIHILGIEHRHSGEVQCLAYNSLNPSATQRSSYTELAVLPRPIQLTNLDVDINDAVPSSFEANAPNEAITNATTTAVTQHTYKQIADVPAYLIRGPDDCIALVGGNVCLTVTYGGYPKPIIKWLRAVSIVLCRLFYLLIFYLSCRAYDRSMDFFASENFTRVTNQSFYCICMTCARALDVCRINEN